MNTIDFVRKLYNGKNCYSDHMSEAELNLLHIESSVEDIIARKLTDNKVVFLTGNPGDGKTFIIKSILAKIPQCTYVETDLNTITDYTSVADKIIECITNRHPAIIAVNEYPFFKLQKVIRSKDRAISSRIAKAQRSSIIYTAPKEEQECQILVIDLNERNLLETNDPNRHLPLLVLEKLCNLLKLEKSHNQSLEYNIKALSDNYVKMKLLKLIKNAIISTEHFAVRDVLGAFAYILTNCLNEDKKQDLYYDSLFNGTNPLLRAIQCFDPIYLTSPELDEELWNGEGKIQSDWIFEAPSKWPSNNDFDDDPKAAIECFKSIKRKYFFENTQSYKLSNLQELSLDKGRKAMKEFDNKKNELKRSIIKGINRLFQPSSSEQRRLQIWTTHKYDLSIETSTSVSSKYVDTKDLEIVLPRPIDWLEEMEYTPNHIILRPKKSDKPSLVLNVEFIRILGLVEEGYPTALLPSHFEQTAFTFLQKLDEQGFAEENDDDEIIVANRKTGEQFKVMIENNKYNFE